jgi:C4-dicarboxylate transporter DctM subunit
LIFIGLPVAFALGLAALGYLLAVGDVPTMILIQRLVRGADSFTLMAIPMFILAGSILNVGGVTKRMIDLARVLVGHFTGALAQINILVSMLFAGVSGSSNADAAGIGKILIPAMIKEGYRPSFAAAVTASSSCVGPIIPPSVVFVILGGIAMIPIGDLFVAGAIPGFLMVSYMMIITYVIAKRNGYARHDRATFSELMLALKRGWLALVAPIIIVGGIIWGIVTATEAGVVAAFYSLFISACIFKEMTLRKLKFVIYDTVLSTSMVMFIVGTAMAFSWVLTRENIPEMLVSFIAKNATNQLVILAMINILCLVLGMFFSVTTNLVMMVPLLLPIVQSIGIHPVHFGVMISLNFMIGTVTPPVGIPMHMVCSIGNCSIGDFVKANTPYYVALLACLITVSMFPVLSLWLPRLFGMAI